MGPSRPDFLCVFLADNRERLANKQEALGRVGAIQGVAWSDCGQGWGSGPLGFQSLTLKQPETRHRPGWQAWDPRVSACDTGKPPSGPISHVTEAPQGVLFVL